MGERELQIMKNPEVLMRIIERQAKEIDDLRIELSQMEEKLFWLENASRGG